MKDATEYEPYQMVCWFCNHHYTVLVDHGSKTVHLKGASGHTHPPPTDFQYQDTIEPEEQKA